MAIVKHVICLVRHRDRYPVSAQRLALDEAGGCKQTFDLSTPEGWMDAVNTMRRGDEVRICHLHLLPEPKRVRTDNPRLDLFERIHLIEDRGAVIREIDSGDRSDNCRSRDRMIARAIERLTKGSRAYIRRKAREGGKAGGRTPKDVSKSEAAARAIWLDPKIDSRVVLKRKLDALRPKWSIARCYRTFGGRSEREV